MLLESTQKDFVFIVPDMNIDMLLNNSYQFRYFLRFFCDKSSVDGWIDR